MGEVLVYTRSSPRYSTSLLVRVAGEDSMRESRGNVSAGGFCFEGAEELAAGTEVELLFRVPGSGVWLSGKGEVLGCVFDDCSVGIRGQFTEFDLGDTQFLSSWLDEIRALHGDNDARPFGNDPDEIVLFSTTVSN